MLVFVLLFSIEIGIPSWFAVGDEIQKYNVLLLTIFIIKFCVENFSFQYSYLQFKRLVIFKIFL